MSAAADTALAVKQALQPHEQQLFLRYKAGKTLRTLAQLYRQYEGENGIREALNELEQRVQQQVRTNRGENGLLARALEPADDGDGGIPVKSVPRGSLNGAGARRDVSDDASHPPAPAPAPSGSDGFDGEERAPSWERIRNLLRASPTTAAVLARACGCNTQRMRRYLESRQVEGSVTCNDSSPPWWRLTDPATEHGRKASEFAVEEVLRVLETGPKTRAEMQDLLSVSKSSVARAIRRLSEEGRIVELERRPPSDEGGAPAPVWALPGARQLPRPPPEPKPDPAPFTHEDARTSIASAREHAQRAFAELSATFDLLERVLDS